MSSDSQQKRVNLLKEISKELRQFQGLGASFFRAAAAQLGMTVTDIQVLDLLETSGSLTAGQLADLTGLTTGAITGMLNRLEETGLVRRVRDPNDGRRVIVQLERGKNDMDKLDPIFASFEKGLHELVAGYDEEQIALLVEFLKRSNALSRTELLWLREAPESEGKIFSTSLGKIESARLIVSSGLSQLVLRADDTIEDLYQASFQGSVPNVTTQEGIVTIRYPRRLWMLGGEMREAEIALNVAIPWQISIQGGASGVEAHLNGLNLAGLEVKGGLNMIHLELPVPSHIVPIRISGGASEITIRRPQRVAARVHLKGWASAFVFDDQTYSDLGNNVRMQSSGFESAAPHYNIEVASSASMVTITSG